MPLIQRAWAGRGPVALALWPLSVLYAIVIGLRGLSYRLGWKRVERLEVPVVVIGNLIAGGAGKTPTVMAVANLLREAGWKPGVVSRGYGRSGDGLLEVEPQTAAADSGDEPLLMRRRLGLPVVVGRDRVAAGRLLLGAHPQVDVILADDGLQHTRLGRDLEIIVFDERGIGNGWLLPAGPLREGFRPRRGRKLVLYNAPAATTPWPGHLARRALAGALSLADWQAGTPASPATWAALAGRPLIAAAGTARPERFFAMLRAHGLDFVALPLPDHAGFDALPWPPGTPDVIVTEKDAVKLIGRDAGVTRIWVAPLDFRPEPAFGQDLLAALGSPTNRRKKPWTTA